MKLVYFLASIIYYTCVCILAILYYNNVTDIVIAGIYLVTLIFAMAPIIVEIYNSNGVNENHNKNKFNIFVKFLGIIYYSGIMSWIGMYKKDLAIFVLAILLLMDIFSMFAIFIQLLRCNITWKQAIQTVINQENKSITIIKKELNKMMLISFFAGCTTTVYWQEKIVAWIIIIVIEIYCSKKVIKICEISDVKLKIWVILSTFWMYLLVSFILDLINIGGLFHLTLCAISYSVIVNFEKYAYVK